ncbi:hypothetical protein L798_01918 [Zootermopsis nevadensis]|uniref:Uncharacterized protein n=1 Tax=Zootermopsis nevadensis TaxID=136037 RepID=A0A067QKS5_ZOONE|nr:hypothetical protein L798_01918 [Zootermopsis nevadensis]
MAMHGVASHDFATKEMMATVFWDMKRVIFWRKMSTCSWEHKAGGEPVGQAELAVVTAIAETVRCGMILCSIWCCSTQAEPVLLFSSSRGMCIQHLWSSSARALRRWRRVPDVGVGRSVSS